MRLLLTRAETALEMTGQPAESALLSPIQALAGRAIVDVDMTVLANVENTGAESCRCSAIVAPRGALGAGVFRHFHCPGSSLTGGSARLSQPPTPRSIVAGDEKDRARK